MTRKLTILGAVAALILVVSGVVIAVSTAAQRGPSGRIVVQNPGESDVIAVVQGKEVTRSDVLELADFHRTKDPSSTENSAVQMVIVAVIDEFIIQAEVERRGLRPTIEETEIFMRPIREICLGPDGGECRSGIQQMGFTTDGYWEIMLPEYQKGLGKINLRNAVFDEQGFADADNDRPIVALDTFQADLRSEALITWHDEDWKRLYRRALESK